MSINTNVKLNYDVNEFFDEDGWIKDEVYAVAVDSNGRVDLIDFSNKTYYQQNSAYIVIELDVGEIQDSVVQFEECILTALRKADAEETLESIKELIDREIEANEFASEIICCFGEGEVIVKESENNGYDMIAYFNEEDSEQILMKTESNRNGTITIIDAWIA